MTEPGWPVADWPGDEPWAQVAETHAAVVFLAGDRAGKLKKPVNLGFLDFTTPQARAAACAREVEFNLEFAPDVYLGVAELRGPGGQVCDHLLVMRRMPGARRLSTLVCSRAGGPLPMRVVIAEPLPTSGLSPGRRRSRLGHRRRPRCWSGYRVAAVAHMAEEPVPGQFGRVG